MLDEVDLAERGVKIVCYAIDTSMMHTNINYFDCLFQAGIYGFGIVINKQVMLPQNDLATFTYCLNSFTGQTFAFS